MYSNLDKFDTADLIPKSANLCIMVIFGITGDLTKRLLYPAICNLGSQGLLDDKFCIVGVAVDQFNDTSFREKFKSEIEAYVTDEKSKQYGLALLEKIYYISGNFSNAAVYEELNKKILDIEKETFTKSCLFYLAAPPAFIEPIAKGLKEAYLTDVVNETYFRRVVVEKPFGHDYDSAKKLNQLLLTYLKEDQIFRIDHYLGKETVQNLMALRFSNGIFEPIWNRRYIDHIQVTVAETLGVEQRGLYYDKAGALRDMLSNHLFQVLSLITMEPPVSFSAHCIQEEKSKALQSINVFTPEQVFSHAVRGQYGAGKINNQNVIGYRAEPLVNPNSNTETFVALKMLIDNWRWLGVPLYLRTGKRLRTRTSQIIIQFKSGPATLFSRNENDILPNILRINIQPEEGISLRFNAKVPGPRVELDQVEMKFKYSDYFGVTPKTGYETILYDCMNGDHTLFNTAEMVETEWTVVQPILDVWGNLIQKDFPNYSAGTWGPKEAAQLLAKDGHEWIL